jgi:PBP1b-binding outer membrane lipoprotein LpoB
MIKGILILILAIICTGCASSKANASSIKVKNLEKPTHTQEIKGVQKECRLMKNGYLVCPKTYQN